MKSSKIVTHNGYAHFDEFLAISLILARHDDTYFYIERREPTDQELNNPNIWVIDIGERYEPSLKNFDHHQDLGLPASFVQVAEYLELHSVLKNAPWWDFKDKIDRRGGYKMAKEIGLDSIDHLSSPLENFLLGIFAESPIAVYQQMKMFGRQLIDNSYKLYEQIDFWKNCEQTEVASKKVIIGHTAETGGSVQFCESVDEPPTIRINYDSRGTGWSLSTIKDTDGVNFYRIAEHEHVKFAHRNGFIAKTKERIPLNEVLQLVELAII